MTSLLNVQNINIYMGLDKIGTSLAQKTYAWVKASGKTSILQTKTN